MNIEHASHIITSATPALSVAQMAEALDVIVSSPHPLSKEEKEGIERIAHILKFHSDRTLTRLLNGHTEANYNALLTSLKEYCESEYNEWVLTTTHVAGGIEEKVECVRQAISVIHRAEDLGIDFVTTEDINYVRFASQHFTLKAGTKVNFRAGRWIYQTRKGRPCYVVASNKVRRLRPDSCRK